MKLYQIYILSFFFLVVASSCNEEGTPTPPSSEASISGLVFSQGINNTPFSVAFNVVEQGDMRIIQNADSLRYRTNIDDLRPVFHPGNRFFSYKKTADEEDYEPITNDTSWNFSQYDSIFVRSTAPDGVTFMDYIVKVKAHKIDPDSVIWQNWKDVSRPWTTQTAIAFSKAVVKGSEIYYFTTQDNYSALHRSSDGKNWNTNYPLSAVLTDVVLHQDKFYSLNTARQLIYSKNGVDWRDTLNVQLDALLFSIGGDLLAIKGDSIVKPTGEATIERIIPLPANFPREKRQTCVVKESAGFEIGYVIGGNQPSDQIFFTNNNGRTWFDYSVGAGSTPFTKRQDANIVSYDNMLWIIGDEQKVEASHNKGLTWRREDKWQWQTKDEYINLLNQTAVVFDNSIFVIGTDGMSIFVWKGRMNKKDFAIQ